MRATLQHINPSDLVHVSNVRDVSRTASNTTDPDLRDPVNSVRTFGVLQPITVRRVGKKFNVVYGHRRALAAVLAELRTVPVYVGAVPEDEVIEFAPSSLGPRPPCPSSC